MLKKLMALTIIATMLLSSFCIIAQAEYDTSYVWGQVLTTKGKSTANADATTGDTSSNKSLYLKGSGQENNGAGAKYYLYDGTTRLTEKDWIRLNQAYTYSYAASGNYAYNGNVVDIMSDLLMIDTNRYGHAGKSFYSSSSNLRGTLEMGKSSSATFNKSTTMTYSVKVKYSTAFSPASFTISAYATGTSSNSYARNINVLKINSDGTMTSGANTYNTTLDTVLELDKEYQFDFVIKLIPTSTTNSYTFEKTIYLKETENEAATSSKIYDTVYTTPITANGAFWRMDIDFEPWTKEAFSDFDKLDTTQNYWYYNATYLGVPSSNITTKYTFIPTKVEFNDFKVYVGDIYAENQPSLVNDDSDFYISSNIRKNTNYVTVAAQTASGDETESGTLMLATYNANKELVSIKTAALGLAAGAITEQDIDISTEDANETKLFIVTNTGNVTPLAKSTVLN